MNEKRKKYFKFWKSPFGKHYIFWTIIFLILIILTTYIQIPDINFYISALLITILIFYFVFGHIFSIFSFDMAKKLFTIIVNLNNYSYDIVKPKKKIFKILFILSTYLLIFHTYFIITDYDIIEALIFGWLILIFVRSSHYVDPKLGSEISKIIGSFFIPFGLIIILIEAARFYVNISTSKIFIEDYLSYFVYFLLFVFATIPLEVLMHYRGKNKQKDILERQKKLEWKKDKSFVKYKQ